MSNADDLAANPTKTVLNKVPSLDRLAASGGSEAVQQLNQPDGSMLLVRVRAGEPAVFEAVPPPEVTE